MQDQQPPQEQEKKEEIEVEQKESSKTSSSSESKKQIRQNFGNRRMARRRSNSPQRRFLNILERWHYTRCSEIKIHFYVRNIYIGNQMEDEFLNFVRERVQKAVYKNQFYDLKGQCELVQICGKNKEEQSIDIAIGMRYDQDAKLIYIGKKHINLASKYNVNPNHKISPVISNIFEIMLRDKGELDKEVLERDLRRQRFGDSPKKRKNSKLSSRGSSKRKATSQSKSKSKSASKSSLKNSRSRSRTNYKKKSQNQPSNQQFNIQKLNIEPQKLQEEPQKKLIAPQTQGHQMLQPALLVFDQGNYISKKTEKKLDYQPVSFLAFQEPPSVKEFLYIFGIPQEYSIQDCINSIKQQYNLQSSSLDGLYKMEKNAFDQIFEYLELAVDNYSYSQILKNLPVKINNVICLTVTKKINEQFSEILKSYQLIVQTNHKIASKIIYNEFKQYDEIVSLYTLQSSESAEYIIIYSTLGFTKYLKPPGEIELFKDMQVPGIQGKVICTYSYLDTAAIQFNRPYYTQTLYAQSQNLKDLPKLQIPAPPPPPQVDLKSDSSSSDQSSEESNEDSRSSSSSRSSKKEEQSYRNRHIKNQGGGRYQRGGNNYRQGQRYNNNQNNNYRDRNNNQDRWEGNEKFINYRVDRQRGGGRQQYQQRNRKYFNDN